MLGLLAYIALGIQSPTGHVSNAYSAMAAHIDPADQRLVSVAAGDLCEHDVSSITEELSARLSIDPPRIETAMYMPHLAEYDPHTATIHMYSCLSESAVLHEFAHHFLQMFSGSYETHLAYAAEFCMAEENCPGTWVASESAPGVELAAHCISYVLIGRHTPLTACDDPERLELARRVISLAEMGF